MRYRAPTVRAVFRYSHGRSLVASGFAPSTRFLPATYVMEGVVGLVALYARPATSRAMRVQLWDLAVPGTLA